MWRKVFEFSARFLIFIFWVCQRESHIQKKNPDRPGPPPEKSFREKKKILKEKFRTKSSR